jgi:tetratricopeptide (TPR) repeat protein
MSEDVVSGGARGGEISSYYVTRYSLHEHSVGRTAAGFSYHPDGIIYKMFALQYPVDETYRNFREYPYVVRGNPAKKYNPFRVEIFAAYSIYFMRLASRYYQLGNMERFNEYFKKARDIEPDNYSSLFFMARELMKLNFPKSEIMALLKSAEISYMKHSDVHDTPAFPVTGGTIENMIKEVGTW